MTMCSPVIRSSLELMLETLQQIDDRPKDLPPALPVRPVSRARLPPARRILPIKLQKVGFNAEIGENEDKRKAAENWGLQSGEFGSRLAKRAAIDDSSEKQMSVGRDDAVVSVLMSVSLSGSTTESESGDDVDLVLNKIDNLGDAKERTLLGVLEIQRCFRGYQVRCKYNELKKGISTLQSFVRGENARKDYKLMIDRLTAATVLQNHMKKRIGRRTTQEKQRAAICLQAAIRGWLTRKQLNFGEDLQERSIEFIKVSKKLDDKNPETKDLVQLPSSVLVDLERRLLRAEAALEKKEVENAVLQQQIQQYEQRWSQYEAKMKSMEKMWQDQLTSLQISLAAARKSLAADDFTSQQGVTAVSRENYNCSASCAMSDGTKSTNRSTPVKHQPHDTELERNSGAVNMTTPKSQQRKKVVHDDSNFIRNAKPQQSAPSTAADVELGKLKQRFGAWKKDYKVRLRETVTALQKLGHSDKEKSQKRWWRRGTQKGHGS